MKYQEILESSGSVLYHGVKKIKYAASALRNDAIPATSTQRFWKDGKRRKDNDPEYKSSFWMKGVSMTRDRLYAESWGDVVFIIDKTILSYKYKIIPFNWGFSIAPPHQNHHKREREEFVVVKSTYDTYMKTDDEDDEKFFDMKRFMTPEGSVKPLSIMLKGIVADSYLKTKRNQEDIEYILNHKKFFGFYDFRFK